MWISWKLKCIFTAPGCCLFPFWPREKTLTSKLSGLPLPLHTSLPRWSSFTDLFVLYLWPLLTFCLWWHVRDQRQYLQANNCRDFLKIVHLYDTLGTRLYHSALLKMCAGVGRAIHCNQERRNTERQISDNLLNH